jgi:hypothetical protein
MRRYRVRIGIGLSSPRDLLSGNARDACDILLYHCSST